MRAGGEGMRAGGEGVEEVKPTGKKTETGKSSKILKHTEASL